MVLGWYKYVDFLLDTAHALLDTPARHLSILLPLGISFFTFQQIAYLVDAYRRETRERNFFNYALFVTFFPQLIAGPIVHHAEMLPQFARKLRVRPNHFAVGLAILTIGLFKKVVLADTLAAWSAPVFQAAESQSSITVFEAWAGVLAYRLQLYLDFSGYSDMAIGVGRMFGIRLPLNFHSPYRSTNIIEFWRRWHITLSRFLRDYLYIPLGGNRKGVSRRYINLLITMVLGGLWHGAGWTFVWWGGLHGLYLVVNHLWRNVKRRLGWRREGGWWSRAGSRTVTFLAVVVGWVFFRAITFQGATHLLACMVGKYGMPLPMTFQQELNKVFHLADTLEAWGVASFQALGMFGDAKQFWWIVGCMFWVFLAPNTQQFMARYRPAFDIYTGEESGALTPRWQWRPTVAWGIFMALLLCAVFFGLGKISVFLYYQF